MPTVDAVIKKGFPTCPQCKFVHKGNADDRGVDLETDRYWFSFICPVCTASFKKGKRKKQVQTNKTLNVRYYTDNNFYIVDK